jgi:hypothetical protein
MDEQEAMLEVATAIQNMIDTFDDATDLVEVKSYHGLVLEIKSVDGKRFGLTLKELKC